MCTCVWGVCTCPLPEKDSSVLLYHAPSFLFDMDSLSEPGAVLTTSQASRGSLFSASPPPPGPGLQLRRFKVLQKCLCSKHSYLLSYVPSWRNCRWTCGLCPSSSAAGCLGCLWSLAVLVGAAMRIGASISMGPRFQLLDKFPQERWLGSF